MKIATISVHTHAVLIIRKFFSHYRVYASHSPIFNPLHSIKNGDQYGKHPTTNLATTESMEDLLIKGKPQPSMIDKETHQ